MGKRIHQSAALPYRWRRGALEILLITSTGRGDWIIPKGLVEPDMTDYDSAAKEAWEEAGVTGAIGTRAIGTYEYQKWGGTCVVTIYDLAVEIEHADWPERSRRKRRWVTVGQAAELVERSVLRDLIRAFSRRARRTSGAVAG